MHNKAQFLKDQAASKALKAKPNPWKKDVLVSDQWNDPGKVTKVLSGDITMKGVPYPVLGKDNTGFSQMMYPGHEYTFPGQSVTEYPQTDWLDGYEMGGAKAKVQDRLGRLHSVNSSKSSFVPWAQTGGTPSPSYTPPPQYLMTNEDSLAYKTYFNRYLAGKAEERANDLFKTPLRPDLLPRDLMNKLLVEKNAYEDAMKQMANRKDGGPSAAKAEEMLHDGTAHGVPLTDKQKRYFGYLSHKKQSGGWLDDYNT